jgi:predicted RNase H-like nuclease (RuvC/YqgF family)
MTSELNITISLIDKLSKCNLNNIIEVINNMEKSIASLTESNLSLQKENMSLKKELESKKDEYDNMNKVSYTRSLSKELTEKKNLITILENQLEKYKNINKSIPTESESMTESMKEPIKKPMEKPMKEYDEDTFEEIEDYELIFYKDIYYLRHNNSKDIYSILNNKVNTKVGSSNSKGKIKFL